MAESLIRNARIRTMDPTAPFAEWLVIGDGRIAARGRGDPPDATQQIDADGRLVLPGFQDAHIHLLSGGLDLATAACLHDQMTEAGLLSSIVAQATARQALPIVLGSGWQPGRFGDHNLTAAVRDRAISDRPLVIHDTSCHNALPVNAARACWRDHFTGMLRPGFSADLVILDRDILACPAEGISGTRVLSTLFKGVEVWRDPDFPAPACGQDGAAPPFTQ